MRKKRGRETRGRGETRETQRVKTKMGGEKTHRENETERKNASQRNRGKEGQVKSNKKQRMRQTRRKTRVRQDEKKIERQTEGGRDREVKEVDWDSIQLIAVSLTAM